MEFYHKVYLFLKLFLLMIYISLKIGILEQQPGITIFVEDAIKIMITFFCIYLFWPFRKKYQIKKHDRDFGFAAGLFMFFNLKLFESVNHNSYLKLIKRYLLLIKKVFIIFD